MTLPEPEIQSLQISQSLLTIALECGKIEMTLPEPKIWSLQIKQNLLTAACEGGNIARARDLESVNQINSSHNGT